MAFFSIGAPNILQSKVSFMVICERRITRSWSWDNTHKIWLCSYETFQSLSGKLCSSAEWNMRPIFFWSGSMYLQWEKTDENLRLRTSESNLSVRQSVNPKIMNQAKPYFWRFPMIPRRIQISKTRFLGLGNTIGIYVVIGFEGKLNTEWQFNCIFFLAIVFR